MICVFQKRNLAKSMNLFIYFNEMLEYCTRRSSSNTFWDHFLFKMSVHKVPLMLLIYDLVVKCMIIKEKKTRVTIKQPYDIYNSQLTNKINYSDTCANEWIGCCVETNLSNGEFSALMCVCVLFYTFKCMRTFSNDVNHKTFSILTEANLWF